MLTRSLTLPWLTIFSGRDDSERTHASLREARRREIETLIEEIRDRNAMPSPTVDGAGRSDVRPVETRLIDAHPIW